MENLEPVFNEINCKLTSISVVAEYSDYSSSSDVEDLDEQVDDFCDYIGAIHTPENIKAANSKLFWSINKQWFIGITTCFLRFRHKVRSYDRTPFETIFDKLDDVTAKYIRELDIARCNNA